MSSNTEQFPIAESAASVVLFSPFAFPYFAVAATIGLALIAVQRSDAAAAEDYYATPCPPRACVALYIGTDRLLGLLAHTTGNLDQ